jgi:transcriptional regulator with XRE-family HTH domain
MNLGASIKMVRKKMGISQAGLCAKCGMSQTALSQIENGVKRPGPKTVKKLCSVMGIPELALYILAMDASCIPESRRHLYQVFYPSIKNLLLQLVTDEDADMIYEAEQPSQPEERTIVVRRIPQLA